MLCKLHGNQVTIRKRSIVIAQKNMSEEPNSIDTKRHEKTHKKGYKTMKMGQFP